MKTATFIRNLQGGPGDARLYKLNPPAAYSKYENDEFVKKPVDHVVVSAARVMFSGPETYIFPHDGGQEDFEGVLDWCEMEGSYRGGLSHEKALEEAGYEIAQ